MIRDRGWIFGQMFVDVVKYLLTIIVIRSIFTEKVNATTVIIGFTLITFFAIIVSYVIPKDKDDK